MAVVESILPANERERMAAVERYDILDTPPDGAFDRITRIASSIFGVPISIVSIVDHDRIWFKSHHGLEGVEQIDREPGLCASAILGDEAWVVREADLDPRTLTNPLVAGEFGLRFYAGVPLTTRDGFNLGTLCVLDTAPKEPTQQQLAMLDDLAALVMDELELRLVARTLTQQAAEINDEVVQSLAVAKMSLQMQQLDEGMAALDDALNASKRILSDLAAHAPTLARRIAAGG